MRQCAKEVGTKILFINIKALRAMKKVMNELWQLWKKSVQWDSKTMKQKAISVWFSISFVLVGISGGSLLAVSLAVVNLGAAAYSVVKYVPMNVEE